MTKRKKEKNKSNDTKKISFVKSNAAHHSLINIQENFRISILEALENNGKVYSKRVRLRFHSFSPICDQSFVIFDNLRYHSYTIYTRIILADMVNIRDICTGSENCLENYCAIRTSSIIT